VPHRPQEEDNSTVFRIQAGCEHPKGYPEHQQKQWNNYKLYGLSHEKEIKVIEQYLQ
jgi:hypothetical protein